MDRRRIQRDAIEVQGYQPLNLTLSSPPASAA